MSKVRIEHLKQKQQFKPFKIVIDVDTLENACMLRSIVNMSYAGLDELIKDSMDKRIVRYASNGNKPLVTSIFKMVDKEIENQFKDMEIR